jgi:aryl-alcohol dehydrogenase-like predicted oxidoreductase
VQYRRVGKWGLKLPEISLGLWHNFGGTAPLERSREICPGDRSTRAGGQLASQGDLDLCG